MHFKIKRYNFLFLVIWHKNRSANKNHHPRVSIRVTRFPRHPYDTSVRARLRPLFAGLQASSRAEANRMDPRMFNICTNNPTVVQTLVRIYMHTIRNESFYSMTYISNINQNTRMFVLKVYFSNNHNIIY